MKRLISRRCLRSMILAGTLLAPAATPGAQDARERFYRWPPDPDFPTVAGGAFWDWLPDPPDSHRGEVLLDLRRLNEREAGQDGWVRRAGSKVVLGSGRPVRFWAVNTTGNAPIAELEQLTAGLARRGVNMIRIHGGASKTLLDFQSGRLDTVNPAVVDQMHKAVVAASRAGIYTFVSNTFFIIQLHVKASYQLEGYTQAWLDAHPRQQVPFGLVFLNDRLRAAFKGWVREFVTAPNPYHEQRTPLAQDRSVAVLEILNEDNLFFYTFNPANWPPEQRALAGAKFFQWVVTKHRQPGDADAEATVRRVAARWEYPLPEDSIERATVALLSAAQMTREKRGPRRIADQIEFLGDVQRGFHAEMSAMLREAGYGGLISASNWTTADNSLLLDLEFDTYRQGDIIDRHAYYAPVVANEKVKHRIGIGDTFLGFSVTANPRASPTLVRQMADYPSAMSEFAWVNYNPAGVEAPLVSAAYCSLVDFDLPVWFALGTKLWHESLGKWAVGRPSVLGQFPGAALLFRRGDVAEAPVVVREGRTLQSVYHREPALVMPGRGFDATRDDPATFAPGRAGGKVDPLAMMVGRVEMTYDTDADEVSPRLGEFIDTQRRRVTSITGQLRTDWRHGLVTINAPRSQAIAGFLRANGPVELDDVTFSASNRFGALLAISIDDQPLATAEKILVQVGMMDRLTGFRTRPVKLSSGGRDYAGHEIESPGNLPWQVERVEATVTFRGMAHRVRSATVLDEDGRARLTIRGHTRGPDYVLTLPADSIYTLIELGPATR